MDFMLCFVTELLWEAVGAAQSVGYCLNFINSRTNFCSAALDAQSAVSIKYPLTRSLCSIK